MAETVVKAVDLEPEGCSRHGHSRSTGGSRPRPGVLMPGHVRCFRVRHKLEGAQSRTLSSQLR